MEICENEAHPVGSNCSANDPDTKADFERLVRLNVNATPAQSYRQRILPREDLDDFDVGEYLGTPSNPYDKVALMNMSFVDQVADIILSPSYCRWSKIMIEKYGLCIRKQLKGVLGGSNRGRMLNRLDFVMPTLPFKDQNPLSTNRAMDSVDLGEYLMMAQMRDIGYALRCVTNERARMVMLTDGLVYTDIFGNADKEAALRYNKNVHSIRDKVTDPATVELVDLAHVIQEFPEFETTQEGVRAELESLFESTEFRLKHKAFFNGMLRNMPLPEAEDLTHAHRIMTAGYESLGPLRQKAVYEAALKYASFWIAMKRQNVVQKAFPSSVRLSTIPKDAPCAPLFVVNRDSTVLPYNGVPVVKKVDLRPDRLRTAVKIMPYGEALQYDDLTEVHVPHQEGAFFYTR